MWLWILYRQKISIVSTPAPFTQACFSSQVNVLSKLLRMELETSAFKDLLTLYLEEKFLLLGLEISFEIIISHLRYGRVIFGSYNFTCCILLVKMELSGVGSCCWIL